MLLNLQRVDEAIQLFIKKITLKATMRRFTHICKNYILKAAASDLFLSFLLFLFFFVVQHIVY
jgi:hypothetical protein